MSRQITYSPAYTIVPTYECFNRCTYCNFRVDPGVDSWLTLSQAQKILQQLQGQGICEILILSGEVYPHSPQRKAWLQRIYDLCQLALSLGFLPHTNAGILSFSEMETLKQVNVSMGLMLEQITPKLLQTVHHNSPSKIPELRLQQLVWAGQLKIPFTTGILLGIGETLTDCWETLEAIATLHQQWQHIQEVILQPHSRGNQQSFLAPPFKLSQLPEIIAKAREILPDSITLQIPPNLILDLDCLLDCLDAGARDLGGIMPKDEVNPDYPHLNPEKIIKILNDHQWQLLPRLPIYPQYDSWLASPLRQALEPWRK
ncbi:MAG TPA: 7,8-didemethyl-8-hydroxy-5-deazariboflavin synthase subunit CofG [Cyanothece sp. UBA12306]|nr:7,8-didemethyl-8-hydroxy-5-deazariboflavin synthase subunit CofG [Cyanothece sp. UBA12306]